ncbi:MAG: DNA repair protein RadA [Chitinivibrionales bacterium]|nr:DNA repair protein RadA [Chitinivibrionales bacterium]
MNKKAKTAFVCTDCGQEFSKWQGHCHACGAWNTISEFRQPRSAARASSSVPAHTATVQTLAQCEANSTVRRNSAFAEVDRVLGGGIVPGAMVLLGGDPGIGKSTLLLQLMTDWAHNDLTALYVSGEESLEQISLRASRLKADARKLLVLSETTIETIMQQIAQVKPCVVVIDSIQTMYSDQLESAPGSVSQVRESAAQLLRYAKDGGVTVFLVGHVTKEGAIAGPRLLEHMVDTVLYFEGDARYHYRIVRSVKNRFGPSGEIAILAMSDTGLSEVTNPSEFFLFEHESERVGTSIVPVQEGSRILLVELQALVNQTHFGLPQRVASGINPKKLALLIAVLERYGGIALGEFDIFFNIAGGLSVAEPAADVGIAAAIISSFRNQPLRAKTAFVGEIGLGGEIRPVNQMGARLNEIARLGYRQCVAPRPRKQSDQQAAAAQIELVCCDCLDALADMIF